MHKRNTEKIQWAILGPGVIAHTFASAMKCVTSGTIVAVHSSRAERAKEFAEKYDIPKHSTDISELVGDPDIDAIYIAYPHTMHFEAIKLCLNHNKHVLCEKPLTVSAQQAHEVVDLARRKELFLMEALWTRFLPVWQQVQTWLLDGTIGTIKSVSSSFGFDANFDPNNRLFNPELGGGALWDLGIYPISMSQFILSESPTSLDAQIIRGSTGVDEHVEATMNYSNGISSQFVVSLRKDLPNDFHIQGSEGSITVCSPFWGAERAILRTSTEHQIVEYNHRVNGFEYQIEHANQQMLLRQQQSPIISWQNSLQSQQILDHLLTY